MQRRHYTFTNIHVFSGSPDPTAQQSASLTTIPDGQLNSGVHRVESPCSGNELQSICLLTVILSRPSISQDVKDVEARKLKYYLECHPRYSAVASLLRNSLIIDSPHTMILIDSDAYSNQTDILCLGEGFSLSGSRSSSRVTSRGGERKMSRPWSHRSTGDSHRILQKDDPLRKVGQPPPFLSFSSTQTMRRSPADDPESAFFVDPTPTRASAGATQPLFDPPRNLARRPEDEKRDALNLQGSGSQRFLLSQNSGL
ncbi:hypothetical protein TNCV_103271 [Trichonephila clavipes]|nr:hypothetical protein TNCV_103271 [Trichonephila clavipes]